MLCLSSSLALFAIVFGADTLNLIYNLADFVNKIAFGVVIWAAATSDESTKVA